MELGTNLQHRWCSHWCCSISFPRFLHFFAFIWCFFAWVIKSAPFRVPESDPYSTLHSCIGSSFSEKKIFFQKNLRYVLHGKAFKNGDIHIHILPNISGSKSNQTMKFSQLIDYNKINIFLQKLYRIWCRETSSRPLFIFQICLIWCKNKWSAA